MHRRSEHARRHRSLTFGTVVVQLEQLLVLCRPVVRVGYIYAICPAENAYVFEMSSTEDDLGVVSATEGDSQSELAPVEGGAGLMAPPAAPQPEGRRRRARKPLRQSSREGAGAAPIPQHRSWKNSRRPRNGHGRGLPKKGSSDSSRDHMVGLRLLVMFVF